MNKKTILGYAVGPIGSGLIGLITLPMITWFYSVEDVGRISMLQVCTSFFVLLSCLGLDQAYVREYHEFLNKPKLLKVVLLPSLLLSLVTLTIVYLYDNLIISQWLYGVPSHYLSIITISCFIVALIARYLSLILRMQEKALAFSMSQLLPKILFLIFVLCVVYLGFIKNIYSLITANALSLFAALLIYLWNTRKDWIPAINEQFDWGQLKLSLAFGLPLVIGGLASWGLNVMDRLFLRSMSTYTELGIYSVTMSVAAVATLISGIFNTIWAPLVYKWVSEGTVDFKKIADISEYVLATIYFIIVFAGIFSWILPFFLPIGYMQIQYLIVACLIGPLFYTLSETTAVGITIVRKTRLSMLASILAMLVSLIANYILVPRYGASGAAISTALAFWCFYILRTEISKNVWRKFNTKKAYFSTILLVALAIIHLSTQIEVFIKIFIWICALLIGCYMFRNIILNLKVKLKF
ncbi:oligosaccharide flippase family protein [Acinetobacter gerneri]|uniref:Oligosaccharide flippase family protein n=1 Tax=Acinetobacter gerneri TaxID=202952 RepID=A0AAW8JII3_9GAMM|nr:oligosaccharide flippase family protein [Acinetobacter gerneri]MDQ9010699.1 oligosaccharide flippase family protein [Acinetobacter gerneri]MDQ9014869.1 oligosaccharide flippase family protein [Acinetobacter gerneri]MDQ9026069.1 oligosaccharide flippase family protein [Acinetobacter gerneri]MDQ9053321.1 oligosaccharide flippase family protein [Acinetobacter gerneri]MDQ9060940.1 oligosaccharide flippase family protein [Acinetobacter gerneri]